MTPPTERKTILILSLSDLGSDPRVSRQIRFLAEHYRVVAAGLGPPAVEVEFVPLSYQPEPPARKLTGAARLLARRYEGYYWGKAWVADCARKLANVRPDLVLANEVDTLPVALKLGARVLCDAHEYAPREFEDRPLWRLFYQGYRVHLCRRYLPRADAVTTVGPSIADAYARDTGVRPAVVTNAPAFHDLRPGPVAAGGPVRLVHHGAALPGRKIENMVRVMKHLDGRYEFDFVLAGSDRAYVERLKWLAGGDERLRFPAPVPMASLPQFLNGYDVGVYSLPPSNFNNRYALPNKFFEFVQARLALAVGPSPEMACLVRQHDLGVVADDFSPAAMARTIRGLDAARIAHHKGRAHAAAWELSGERNREVLLGLVAEVLGDRKRRQAG